MWYVMLWKGFLLRPIPFHLIVLKSIYCFLAKFFYYIHVNQKQLVMILLFGSGPEYVFTTPMFWIIFIILLVSYILRAIPPFKYIWYLFVMIIAYMFLGYLVDRGKDRIKDWFKED
jgi:hypothetical protein